MNKEEFQNKNIKVEGSSLVQLVEPYELHPDYKIELYPNTKGTDTGFVKFGELRPKKEGLPKFVFRWDHRKTCVDVDISPQENKEKNLWEVLGYAGHHPIKIPSDARKYEVEIKKKLPDQIIFKGVLDVGVLIGSFIKDSISVSDSVSGKIIKPGDSSENV